MGKWTVYKHTLPDGRVYIGITSLPPEERWNKGFGYLQQRHFFRLIVEVGWNNIKHEIIASNISENTARMIEKELISQEKSNAINIQHHTGVDLSWTEMPVCADDLPDRKAKFRNMSDRWLDKVRYEGTPPYDWDIDDDHIDFKYLIDEGEVCSHMVIRVSIPEDVTYRGLYDYLYWKLDFKTSIVVGKVKASREIMSIVMNRVSEVAI